MTAAVTFEHVSKSYQRGHAPSFREDTTRTVRRLLFHDVPRRPQVDALRDVNFEIEQASSFAVMGPNGSGKTTALRLISRITYPTAGAVRVRGRVGALIEVGTGLHPELTGRENIWLYGRILGLRGRDIARSFDSIVDFADIGVAIDQPVKQFSTGMQLRLGFALASHLEPDVLIVDEAVSVGDAGFQRRCVQRMAALHKSGATLVFVSHAPTLVASLCQTGIRLNSGTVEAMGPVEEIVEGYVAEAIATETREETAAEPIKVRSWDYQFTPRRGRYLGDLAVQVFIQAPTPLVDPVFGIGVSRPGGASLIGCSSRANGLSVGTVSGNMELRCDLEELPLEPGDYEVWFTAMDDRTGRYFLAPHPLGPVNLGRPPRAAAGSFESVGTTVAPVVVTPYRWEVIRDADATAAGQAAS